MSSSSRKTSKRSASSADEGESTTEKKKRTTKAHGTDNEGEVLATTTPQTNHVVTIPPEQQKAQHVNAPPNTTKNPTNHVAIAAVDSLFFKKDDVTELTNLIEPSAKKDKQNSDPVSVRGNKPATHADSNAAATSSVVNTANITNTAACIDSIIDANSSAAIVTDKDNGKKKVDAEPPTIKKTAVAVRESSGHVSFSASSRNIHENNVATGENARSGESKKVTGKRRKGKAISEKKKKKTCLLDSVPLSIRIPCQIPASKQDNQPTIISEPLSFISPGTTNVGVKKNADSESLFFSEVGRVEGAMAAHLVFVKGVDPIHVLAEMKKRAEQKKRWSPDTVGAISLSPCKTYPIPGIINTDDLEEAEFYPEKSINNSERGPLNVYYTFSWKPVRERNNTRPEREGRVPECRIVVARDGESAASMIRTFYSGDSYKPAVDSFCENLTLVNAPNGSSIVIDITQ